MGHKKSRESKESDCLVLKLLVVVFFLTEFGVRSYKNPDGYNGLTPKNGRLILAPKKT